jgi:hypothetical protein
MYDRVDERGEVIVVYEIDGGLVGCKYLLAQNSLM